MLRSENELFDPQAGLDLVQGNQIIYQTLLRYFIQLYADLPATVQELIQTGNQKGLARICHNLKSTTGQVGSAVLSSRSGLIEKAIKSSGWPLENKLAQELESLTADIIQLVNQIKMHLDQVDAAPASTQASTPASELAPAPVAPAYDLKRLEQALAEHDPIGSRQSLNMLIQSGCPEDIRACLSKIEARLNMYQFEQALALLDQLQAGQAD